MSVDATTVRRIAHLARIAVADEEVEHLRGELNAILAFVEQLSEVKVDGVDPMTSVTPMAMKKRSDEVTDGGIADDIVKNAPAREDHFFVVPNVVVCCAKRIAPPSPGARSATRGSGAAGAGSGAGDRHVRGMRRDRAAHRRLFRQGGSQGLAAAGDGQIRPGP
ncbi:MAG: aspartyl-tRNA(Asn)/glutamyl-tRNA(Gln) amidotransferase subunit [Alphaproteobacteria bacterium]|nr:aspartyl-tRNA(Asn)/glutamyl-tRNA(Gln) amidotransferase subunit [Alphaproteobacteria bacterium]